MISKYRLVPIIFCMWHREACYNIFNKCELPPIRLAYEILL